MVSVDAARKLAMSLPEVEECDHFGSPSFRVKGKIFAQLSRQGDESERALVKMTAADQAALTMSAPDVFSSVPQWGKHGWTYAKLAAMEESALRDLFLQSWRLVAPRKLVEASRETKTKKIRRGG